MANSPEKTNSEPPDPFVIKAMRWAAYPVSATLAWLSAHVTMRDKIFTRLKKYGAFDDIIKEHEKDLAFLKEAPRDSVEDLSRVNMKYKNQINTRMRERGFKSTWNYWKGIHDIEKLEAGFLAFSAVGITLGVMLTLADNKSFQHLFSRKEKEKEPDQGVSK